MSKLSSSNKNVHGPIESSNDKEGGEEHKRQQAGYHRNEENCQQYEPETVMNIASNTDIMGVVTSW